MEDDEELMHVNPCPPSWLSDEQKAILRGDNVEGTAYTERWMLTTLMTILKTLHDLLPTLQMETNLTTYDFTPSKSPGARDCGRDGTTPLATPQHTACGDDGATTPSTSTDATPSAAPAAAYVAVEIPSDVDKVACQLWDMCVDKHVAMHVLQLSDNLVLHMLYYALREPTAVRLTEILCGLVSNLCCEDAGCIAVLQHQELLDKLVSLPERCTDSLVLLYAFKLLHRLLLFCRPNEDGDERPLPADGGLAGERTTDTGVVQGSVDVKDNSHNVGIHGVEEDDSFHTVDDVSYIPRPVGDAPGLAGQVEGEREGRPQLVSNNCMPDGEKTSANSEMSTGSADKTAAVPTCFSTVELSKNLSLALHSCSLESFLTFTIEYSFNEELVSKTISLLRELLFFHDPLVGVLMARHYADTGIVRRLVRIVSCWHSNTEQQQQQRSMHTDDDFVIRAAAVNHEDEELTATDTIHNAFVCLAAFVDTKAADELVSNEGNEPSLEPPLVHYINELVTSSERELRRHKPHHRAVGQLGPPQDCPDSCNLLLLAEKLDCALKLLALLLRSLRLPEVMIGLARLLALLDHSGIFAELLLEPAEGAGLQGDHNVQRPDEASAAGNDLNESPQNCDAAGQGSCKFTHSKSISSPEFEVNESVPSKSRAKLKPKRTKTVSKNRDNHSKSVNRNHNKSILDLFDSLSGKHRSDCIKKEEQDDQRLKQQQRLEFQRQLKVKNQSRTRRRSSLLDNSFNDVSQVKDSDEITCLAPSTMRVLAALRLAMEEYFASILRYWFTYGDLKESDGVLCSIVRVLEQCHVHEVLLILDAAKKADHALVSKIQELMLDNCASQRIIALLGQLYQ